MLDSRQLLAELEARGIKNADIARALGIDPAGVTRLRKGVRQLLLDEAVKLVSLFGLEQPQGRVSPLPAPISRLVVLYLAHELGANRESPERIEELAQDIRAFAEFVADPKVRSSVEAAEAFFQAMRLRRPTPDPADPRGTDPTPVI